MYVYAQTLSPLIALNNNPVGLLKNLQRVRHFRSERYSIQGIHVGILRTIIIVNYM